MGHEGGIAIKKAIILSANCSPGHVSHLNAYYELFSEMGYESYLALDPSYKQFLENTTRRVVYLFGWKINPEVCSNADVLLIENLSTHDVAIVRQLKRCGNPRVLLMYHEPWYGYRYWLNEVVSHRVAASLLPKNIGIHQFAKSIIKQSDAVLLPSQRALDIYRQYDYSYNKICYVVSLPYVDEVGNKANEIQREFDVSFIATADKEKNFPLFIDYLLYCFDLFPGFCAQIITRSNIDQFWKHELDAYVDNGSLVVKSGSPLSNEEINTGLMRSKAAWLVYHHSTQSGVLARAFMCGCPVLSSNNGCFPRYVNGENGVVCKSESIPEIAYAHQEILAKLGSMTEGARRAFQQFHYSANLPLMRELLLWSNDPVVK